MRDPNPRNAASPAAYEGGVATGAGAGSALPVTRAAVISQAGTVATTGSWDCGGSPPGCYWTGGVLEGSYKPNANTALAKYYLANEGSILVPVMAPTESEYLGNTEMTMWTGLDNVFQVVLAVAQTRTVMSYLVDRQFHLAKSSKNPSAAGDSSGIPTAFTITPGKSIFTEEWYCDAKGNAVLSGGYACTYMADAAGHVWNCNQANSTTCASYWMASGDAIGTTAEYILENDGPQYGGTYEWPGHDNQNLSITGSALVVTGANTVVTGMPSGSGASWVNVTTDPLVYLLKDTPPSGLSSGETAMYSGFNGTDQVVWAEGY